MTDHKAEWVLVPRVATPEMLRALWAPLYVPFDADRAYEKMIAAAPAASEGEDGAVAWACPEDMKKSNFMALNANNPPGLRGRAYSVPLYTRPAAQVADTPKHDEGWEEVARIGELIRTQDNRITSHPIFVVEQQRTVYAVDTDYDHDGFDWLDKEGPVEPRKAARLERLHQAGGDTGEYRRLGFKHYWEFVTACFTEQGCTDYLASNGHNLKAPRVYVYSGWRNAEWQVLREHLAALATQPAPKHDEGRIAEAVNRFLCWRLPDDFAPDSGISYTPITRQPGWLHDLHPTGTNLFNAAQAKAMFEHCLATQPAAVTDECGRPMTYWGGKSATQPTARRVTDGVASRANDAASRQEKAAREGVCLWTQQDDGDDLYSTDCGHEFTVNECTDGNVTLPYCPFCARELDSIAWGVLRDESESFAQPAEGVSGG